MPKDSFVVSEQSHGSLGLEIEIFLARRSAKLNVSERIFAPKTTLQCLTMSVITLIALNTPN